MKNLTLAIDEELLRASREYARKNETTLNALIRDFLEGIARPQTSSIDDFLALADEYAVDSAGYAWNREDIYSHV
jgi:hypothetical protein